MDKYAFPTHTDLLALSDALVNDGKSKIAQAVVICVQDKMHAELTIEFARRGFHILCEKPLGVDVAECIRVAEEVERSGVVYALGHSMSLSGHLSSPTELFTDFPYSPYAASITELIRSGQLGRLLHIAHLEPIGYYHFAHSYVRGNWQSEKSSAPIVLTKSSHDLDIFNRWLWPLVPSKVASFGGLSHFRKERKPAEARLAGVKRCLECPASVEQRCEYSAKKSQFSQLYPNPSLIITSIPCSSSSWYEWMARKSHCRWPTDSGEDDKSPRGNSIRPMCIRISQRRT